MAEIPDTDTFQMLASAWDSALGEKRHRDVILSGLAAYLLFREKQDTAHESATLVYIRRAIDELLTERYGAQKPSVQYACSFCYRAQPEVRLAAGPNVFICETCVSTLSEVFKEQATPPNG